METILRLEQELRIHRLLGVRRFRRLILAYARVRHFRSGGRNPRYHLKGFRPEDAQAFLPRLRRNVRLHLLSLALLVVYWVGLAMLKQPEPLAVPLSLFLLWLNGGCLLLQRNHYVRIRLLQEKRRLSSEKSP